MHTSIIRRSRVLSSGFGGFKQAAAAAGYAGPGDLNPGAWAWWGLRAYSAAAIGTNALEITRASDSVAQSFKTVAGGGLDLAAITSFLTSTTGLITNLFDQSGNGRDLPPHSGSNAAPFALSSLGALPSMDATGGGTKYYDRVGLDTQIVDPLTMSMVYLVTSATTFNGFICQATGVRGLHAGIDGDNTLSVFENFATIAKAAANNTWHAAQAVCTGGASSSINVDGSASTGSLGAAGTSTTVGIANNLASAWKAMELGIWASGSLSDMTANQRAYYGF